MHPIKFRFIWPSGFREDFLEIEEAPMEDFVLNFLKAE
jgi:hypothetical protein